MRGDDIRIARKQAGLSQTELGRLAGIGRHAVSYWECKESFAGRGWALERMAAALGRFLPDFRMRSCARGDGVLGGGVFQTNIDHQSRARAAVSAAIEKFEAKVMQTKAERSASQEAAKALKLRVVCCAKTRKGTPCRNLSEPGRTRCKFHGEIGRAHV